MAGRRKKSTELVKDNKSLLLESNHRIRPEEFIPRVENPPQVPMSGWTQPSILMAIQSLDDGQFSLPELLFQAMLKHPRIASGLQFRSGAVRNLPFSLKVPYGAPAIISKKAQLLEREFFNTVLPPGTLQEINKRLTMFNFCIARMNLVAVEDQFLPQITTWTLSNSWYNMIERSYYTTVYPDGPVKITGEPWIIFTKSNFRPWLGGLIRALARPFAMSNFAYDRWNYFNDTEALAYKHLTVPANKREQRENAAEVLKTEQSRGGDTVETAVGYDFKLVTSGGRGSAFKTFETMIEDSNNDIAILLLGSNLAQEIKGGSFAATKSVYDRFIEIAKFDVEPIARTLYDTVCRYWVEKNFTPALYGENSLTQYRPLPVFDASVVEDPSEKAQEARDYATSVSTFLSAAVQAGAPLQDLDVDWQSVAERCGLILNKNRHPEVVVDGDE